MTVTPLRPHRFQEYDELHQFLLSCQQNLDVRESSQIISISIETSAIDPLLVLEKMGGADRLSFYWEQPERSEAIAAIDAVTYINTESNSRFIAATDFIDNCLRNITVVGEKNNTWLEPLFFCAFTFFDRLHSGSNCFPPATIFLPRFQVFRRGKAGGLVANLKIDRKTNISLLSRETWQQFQKVRKLGSCSRKRVSEVACSRDLRYINRDSDRFKDGVRKALDAAGDRTDTGAPVAPRLSPP